MSDGQSLAAQLRAEEDAQRDAAQRCQQRLDDWRQTVAAPYESFYRGWKPTWDDAAEQLDAAFKSGDRHHLAVSTAADRLSAVAGSVRRLTAQWEKVRAWRSVEHIGDYLAREESGCLYGWGDPCAACPSPAERFGPAPEPPVGRVIPLAVTLELVRAALDGREGSVREQVEEFGGRDDCRGVGGWLRLIGDVLAPPPGHDWVHEVVNGFRIPEGADPAGVRHVVWRVGGYGNSPEFMRSLDDRLRTGSAPPPEMPPGMAAVMKSLHGPERHRHGLISALWHERMNSPDAPPLERAAMRWHLFAGGLGPDRSMLPIQQRHRLIDLARALVG